MPIATRDAQTATRTVYDPHAAVSQAARALDDAACARERKGQSAGGSVRSNRTER